MALVEASRAVVSSICRGARRTESLLPLRWSKLDSNTQSHLLIDDAVVFCLLMGDYPTERIAARAILSFGEKTRGLVVESREPWWRARNGLCFCGGTEG